MTIYETYKYIYTGNTVHIPCNLGGTEYHRMMWNPLVPLHPFNFAISDQVKQAGDMTRIPKESHAHS